MCMQVLCFYYDQNYCSISIINSDYMGMFSNVCHSFSAEKYYISSNYHNDGLHKHIGICFTQSLLYIDINGYKYRLES